jgi:restriction system protein
MPIPDYESLMLPFLDEIRDGREHRVADIRERISARLGLTDEELSEMLPSGSMPVFNNRLHWAKFYLDKAGLLATPTRGIARITPRGESLLNEGLAQIDNRVLSRFPEFLEFKQKSKSGTRGRSTESERFSNADGDGRTPEEVLGDAHRTLREAVEDELLQRIMAASPAFLEKLVINLLRQLGYGGAGGAGERVGRSGDGGVDGVIWEDKLGLEVVYVQAKRWQGSVGRPLVQAFTGSLEGFGARKGVMITTSTFTADARDYVDRIEKRIVLIDGKQLVRMMFDIGLGVSTKETYAVKAIDNDYFDEDL